MGNNLHISMQGIENRSHINHAKIDINCDILCWVFPFNSLLHHSLLEKKTEINKESISLIRYLLLVHVCWNSSLKPAVSTKTILIWYEPGGKSIASHLLTQVSYTKVPFGNVTVQLDDTIGSLTVQMIDTLLLVSELFRTNIRLGGVTSAVI